MKRTTLTIEVSAEQLAALAVLDPRGDVQQVLDYLLWCVTDEVRRPGAWERGWLEQAFGAAWQRHLEVDPEASWRQRPRPCWLDEDDLPTPEESAGVALGGEDG